MRTSSSGGVCKTWPSTVYRGTPYSGRKVNDLILTKSAVCQASRTYGAVLRFFGIQPMLPRARFDYRSGWPARRTLNSIVFSRMTTTSSNDVHAVSPFDWVAHLSAPLLGNQRLRWPVAGMINDSTFCIPIPLFTYSTRTSKLTRYFKELEKHLRTPRFQ